MGRGAVAMSLRLLRGHAADQRLPGGQLDPRRVRTPDAHDPAAEDLAAVAQADRVAVVAGQAGDLRLELGDAVVARLQPDPRDEALALVEGQHQLGGAPAADVRDAHVLGEDAPADARARPRGLLRLRLCT